MYYIYFGFQIFSKWNYIPHQCIKANLTAMGVVSDSSSCHFRIRINAGRKQDEINNNEFCNSIYIDHRTDYSRQIHIDETFYRKFTNIAKAYRCAKEKMQSFYVLDYCCSTTIDIKGCHSDASIPKFGTQYVSYIDAPVWEKRAGKSIFSGNGFVAFANYTPSSDYVVIGKGGLEFNTDITNLAPNYNSPWDITQSTYEISFSCKDIRCDTISIEFYGATLFSDMYPKPDKTTMCSIEFTSYCKIQEIMNNGLYFHTEFIELKELAAMRMFILTALISAIIAFLINVIYGYLYGRD